MQRRTFVRTAAIVAASIPIGSRRPYGVIPQPRPDALIWDAMGELREEYDAALICAMLASGMDAITITLCDPKPEGAEALELAIDSLLQHDRYLARHAEFFVKATTVADVDRARRERKLAVLYLFQNTVQFGKDLDRVDLFHRMGLRSCQLTYNTKKWGGRATRPWPRHKCPPTCRTAGSTRRCSVLEATAVPPCRSPAS